MTEIRMTVLAGGDAPPPLAIAAPRPWNQPEPPVRSLARILVSDDNPGIRQIYQMLLPRHGFEVISVPGGDGDKTLELCQALIPDLVITDVNKPGLSGYAVCQAIRKDPRTAHIPVLFVTAMDEWLERRRGRAVGADDYIVKPFLFEGLLYRLAMLLALARDAQERLVTLTLRMPNFEHYHPVTGMPGPQALARALPRLTSGSAWAALTFEISGFDLLLRAYGRLAADDLLLRLASILRAALAWQSDDLLLAHPGYDWRLTVVGPARLLDGLGSQVAARFAAELQRRLAPADLAFGKLTFTDSRGQIQHAPLPRLTIRRLDAGIGSLTSLRALWDALDHADLLR